MSGLLDTSVVVRYVVGDAPELERTVRRIVEREEVLVSSVVLAESAFVLMSVYGVPRHDVVDVLIELCGRRNVKLLGLAKDVVIEALLLCRPSGRVSFVDALTWAEARSNGIAAVFTLDRHFPSAGLTLLPPR